MNNCTFELPPGKYFIGDVSYFLTDKYYESVKENLFDYGGYKMLNGEAKLTTMKSRRGCWRGSNQMLYYINSGILGVCSFDIGEDMGAGSTHDFKDKIYVDISVEGVLMVCSGSMSIVIDTNADTLAEDGHDGYDSYS